MRRITAALLSSALITPAVVLLPTVDLRALTGGGAAEPRPVDPVVTALALDPSGSSVSRNESGMAAQGAPSTRANGPEVLTAPMKTKPFETVAVTWDLPSGSLPSLAVSARVHGDDGWGGWFELEVDDVNATAADVRASTGGSAKGYRGGTEPYWAGESDGVQVRVDVTAGALPSGLKVELIDPGSSAYDAVVGARPPGSAESAPSRPTIHSRASWGANESRVRDEPTEMPTIKAAVIHHTAGENGYSRVAVPRILRSTYAYHLSRGWDDIGYNFLVDRFGRIWEGRAGGVEKAIQGAHAGGFNHETFGVSLMGNYDGGTKPSSAALDAVARLIAWKLDLFRVDPLGKVKLTSSGGGTARYKAGKTVSLPTIMGHRNVGYTACPGKNVYSKLGSIRAKVAKYTQAQLIGVKQSGTAVDYGSRGPTVKFAPLTSQSWRLAVADACTNSAAGSARGSSKRGQSVKAVWNGKVDGKTAKAGLYRATVTSSSKSGSARPFTGVFAVRPPENAPVKTGAAGPEGPGSFTPVAPVRLYDSQSGAAQPLGPKGRVDLKVSGRGGVPATGVTHVVLSVTAPCASESSAFRVRPAGRALTGISALTFRPGAQRTIEVVVPVGAGGYVSVRNASGVAHLRVDLVGYYGQSAGAGFRAVPQTPVLDSRSGAAKPFTPGSRRTVTVPKLSGIAPSKVRAVLVALTAFAPNADGQVSAYAYGGPVTTGTTLAYGKGATAAGTATVAVRDGKFSLRNRGGTAHLQAVVVGVFTTVDGAQYDELTPRRIWGASSGSTVGSSVKTFRIAGGSTGVPADATAVTLWVRATGAKAASALSVWATGSSAETVTYPVVRLGKTATVTTKVVVPVAESGRVGLKAVTGSAKVNVSVVGYYR